MAEKSENRYIKLQKRMLEINKRKPTPEMLKKLWDNLLKCGVAEKNK